MEPDPKVTGNRPVDTTRGDKSYGGGVEVVKKRKCRRCIRRISQFLMSEGSGLRLVPRESYFQFEDDTGGPGHTESETADRGTVGS